jgi:protocatechuate 3,4-dioxygenase alpha subunit
VIEIWQADAAGKYADESGSGFRGFGRVATDNNGGFRFTSIKPGRVSGPHETLQAPHLVVTIFMRGLLLHLYTRIYFPDEPANATDPILSLTPAERRATLVASKAGGDVLRWDVLMQGEDETVFFYV